MKSEIIFPSPDKNVILTGKNLTIEDFISVTRKGARVNIADSAIDKLRKSNIIVNEIVESQKPTYGINTGFGELSNVSVKKESIDKLQENLILSHCTAVGNPYPTEVVRGMMLLRANALCNGYSGIRPLVVQTIIDMLNAGVHPIIPEKGSLGSSGDLAPLAHMVLPLIGYGEAEYKGATMSGAIAMKKAGLTPCKLGAKEGLALVNGTQAMTSVGALSYYDTLHAARLADIACSLTMEALEGLKNAFDARVHAVRPHQAKAS